MKKNLFFSMGCLRDRSKFGKKRQRKISALDILAATLQEEICALKFIFNSHWVLIKRCIGTLCLASGLVIKRALCRQNLY